MNGIDLGGEIKTNLTKSMANTSGKSKEEIKSDQANYSAKGKATENEIDEIFSKHLKRELDGYVNFNHKEDKFLDTYNFSWGIHGYDIFSKFMPVTTKIITNQMNYAF